MPLKTSELKRHIANLREIFVLAWPEIDTFVKRRLVVVLLLVLTIAVIDGLTPVAMKLAVDDLTQPGSATSISPLVLVVLYVSSHWLVRVLTEARVFLYSRAERRMYRTLSSYFFDHIMQLPLRFHLNKQTGAFGQTMTNGVQGYQTILQHGIFTFLPVAMQLITISLILLHFDHPIFLGLFFVALLFYGVIFARSVMRIANPSRAVSDAHIHANAVMTDSILNYETVKYFNAESLMRGRFDAALTNTEHQWMRFFRLRASNGLAIAMAFGIFLAVTLIYAAWQTMHGRMTVGDFVLVTTYMFQAVRPVETLGIAFQQLAQGFAFLDRMLQLLRQRREHGGAGRASTLAQGGSLEFDAVSLAYNPAAAVLKNVSFELSSGRTLAIVGGSGAGKSTLVRLVVRLLEPDSGRILLDGVPTSELSLRQLRQAIAVVPQDTALFDDTIAYNIALGKPGSSIEAIEDAARVAHLHDFVMGLPDGYQTRVGERGVKLSGGEKQRVSIARAVLRQPGIYVFDEATSSLDSRTERQILLNLRHVSRHNTTLVIAHRLSTVMHADEIIVLDGGSIVERGTHKELLRKNGTYAALWDAQNAQEILS